MGCCGDCWKNNDKEDNNQLNLGNENSEKEKIKPKLDDKTSPKYNGEPHINKKNNNKQVKDAKICKEITKNDFKADNFEIISLNDEIKDGSLKEYVKKTFDDKTKSSLNCIISNSKGKKFYIILHDCTLKEIYFCLTEHNENMEQLIKKIPVIQTSTIDDKTTCRVGEAYFGVIGSCLHGCEGNFCDIKEGALFFVKTPVSFSNKKEVQKPIQITAAIDWNGRFKKVFEEFYIQKIKLKHIKVLENPDKERDFLMKNKNTNVCLFRIDSDIQDDIVLEGKKEYKRILGDKNINRNLDEYFVLENSNYCLAKKKKLKEIQSNRMGDIELIKKKINLYFFLVIRSRVFVAILNKELLSKNGLKKKLFFVL